MHSFPRLFTSAPTATSRTATAYAEATPEPAAQQPALPKVRKTSNMPGLLRGLLDKPTAKYERAMARVSTDAELQQALLTPGSSTSNRQIRAIHQEAKKRAARGQWNPQPPATTRHAGDTEPPATDATDTTDTRHAQAHAETRAPTPEQTVMFDRTPSRSTDHSSSGCSRSSSMRSSSAHSEVSTEAPPSPPSAP